MLVFEHIAMFEAIYDVTKKLYPEIMDVTVTVGYAPCRENVQLLEGYDEDKGKYKIVINPQEDKIIVGSLFVSGMAMLVYHLKSGGYVHPITRPHEASVSTYKTYFQSIADAFANASDYEEVIYE